MTLLPRLDPAPPPVDPGLLSRALEVAGRLANDAAEVISATVGRGDPTGMFDWVTHTDRTLERHTRRVLAGEFPEVPVVGEEHGGRTAGAHSYRWVVGGPGETRCGTANHVAGLPWCAYSLALVDAAGPVVGVIADPSRGQIYAAARGRGMRANGLTVQVGTRSPVGGLICCELGAHRCASFVRAAAAAHARVRVLGSAALAITQVALGHAVAAVLDGYREWDVAGALCLAGEAGAVVVDALGRPDPLPAGGLVVAQPAALDVVLGWWRSTSPT